MGEIPSTLAASRLREFLNQNHTSFICLPVSLGSEVRIRGYCNGVRISEWDTELRPSYGDAVDGWKIPAEFPMKPTALMLSTVANPKAGPESGEGASPRKTTDLSYVGPHEPGIRASWSWLWPKSAIPSPKALPSTTCC